MPGRDCRRSPRLEPPRGPPAGPRSRIVPPWEKMCASCPTRFRAASSRQHGQLHESRVRFSKKGNETEKKIQPSQKKSSTSPASKKVSGHRGMLLRQEGIIWRALRGLEDMCDLSESFVALRRHGPSRADHLPASNHVPEIGCEK